MPTYHYGTLARFAGKLWDANAVSLPASAEISKQDLNSLMQFDHVVQVHADGSISEPRDSYGPDLYDSELDQHLGDQWQLFTHGYTQQYGYSGPIMHDSEYIGGHLARDILAKPGLYVALVNYGTVVTPYADVDSEPEGWAIAFKPTDETSPPEHNAEFHERLERETGRECPDCWPWSNPE